MIHDDVSRTVAVPNPQGVHARPCFQIYSAANRFRAAIDIVNSGEGVTVNAKSMVDLLTLNAPQGTHLLLRARGEDADQALDELVRVIASGFGEMHQA